MRTASKKKSLLVSAADGGHFNIDFYFILHLMAVKTPIDYTEGIYFVTFTCQDWLSLFEITNSYDTVQVV